MSFDDKQHKDDDEIDLAELFRNIWSYKFTLLIFIILSVPTSIAVTTVIKPTYKAETVFEKPSTGNTQNNRQLINASEGLGFLALLSGGIGGASDSFISEIRSKSFMKTVILNNPEINIQEFCPLPSKQKPRFSLRSLLIALGISENKDPSESQKVLLLVKCVNEMLEIEFDTHGSSDSSAYKLSIESGDPIFSANLANQIVEKYFVFHEKKRDQDFQNVKEYLSSVITEAQLEYTEANKLMQGFKIKNTLLMNISPLFAQTNLSSVASNEMLVTQSPFASELNRELANLSQLEKTLSKLNQAKLKLSKLKEGEQYKTYEDILAIEIQEMFSRAFITAISKMNNSSAGTNVINQEIKKIVSQELMSLKQQIQSLEEKISQLEEQTMKLMTIENRFQELAIDLAKKKLIFEGLKDQLKEKILTAGLANIEQPVLLSKAVPPFNRAYPNKKLIVVFGVLLSLIAGVAYILLRQMSSRKIYSISQLQRISNLNCYGIKYKKLKQMGKKSDETEISQSFFSHSMKIGKFGCIIDLSKETNNYSLASEFSNAIASLLVSDKSKIICLDTSPSESLFSDSASKNFPSNRSDDNPQGAVSKGTLTFNDKEGMISAEGVKEIKNKYSDYDKVVCTLGAEIGDLTKFKFIEQCDFYILIGRTFHFDEYTCKKFSNTVWEKEKKCLGFFLID